MNARAALEAIADYISERENPIDIDGIETESELNEIAERFARALGML